jgi:DNA-binding response OmpR family regulator
MRVLVVEDDHKIANALKKALEQEKYAVDVSYDGDDGYAMATTEPYDVAIVDRMIPGEYNGLQIVESMRQAKIHTPVILLTALSSIRDRTKGLDSGADDYLVKPFALEELLARVRALIRRPTEQQASVLQYKDLSMDTNNFVVKRADKTINLTSREFSLLEYLMRNPDRTVTKDVIISHVWNYDADILPNTVEVYIKYLRGKIDAPFKNKLIHTIRGFGYRLGES